MWFGPKGFASVVYGLLVLESGIAAADKIFHLVALTIVLSILAHSSTDVVVARQFDEPGELPGRESAVLTAPNVLRSQRRFRSTDRPCGVRPYVRRERSGGMQTSSQGWPDEMTLSLAG